MKYRDLPPVRPVYRAGAVTIQARQPILYCAACGEEYSANPGDYFMAEPDAEIICQDCGTPMRLAERVSAHLPYGTADAFSAWAIQQWDKARGPDDGRD